MAGIVVFIQVQEWFRGIRFLHYPMFQIQQIQLVVHPYIYGPTTT